MIRTVEIPFVDDFVLWVTACYPFDDFGLTAVPEITKEFDLDGIVGIGQVE